MWMYIDTIFKSICHKKNKQYLAEVTACLYLSAKASLCNIYNIRFTLSTFCVRTGWVCYVCGLFMPFRYLWLALWQTYFGGLSVWVTLCGILGGSNISVSRFVMHPYFYSHIKSFLIELKH